MVGRQEREKRKTKNEDHSLKAKDSLLISGEESLTPSSEGKKKKKGGREDVSVSSSVSEGNPDVNTAADKNEKKEKKKKKSERHEATGEDVAVSFSPREGNVDVNNIANKNDKKEKKKKKKSERHDASGEDVAISSSQSEGNVDVNNAADKNEKKEKKKRNLEHGNDEKESQVARKKNKVSEVREALEETHMRIEDNTGLQKNVWVDFVSNSESEVIRDGKKNHKEKNREGKSSTISSVVNILNHNRREEVAEVQNGPENEDIANMNSGEGWDHKKKRKKKHKKYDDGGGDTEVIKCVADGKDAGRVELIEIVQDKVESSQKEKEKKRKMHNVDLEAASTQIMAEMMGNQSSVIEGDGCNTSSIKNKARDGKLKVNAEGGNNRKKKAKSLENRSKEKSSKRVTQMEKDIETTGPSEKSSSKVTSKRVSFGEDVEVFPSSDEPSDEKAVGKDGLVRGKRFSPEEDEMVKEAVLNYINVHDLGAEGLNMVLNCKKHPAITHCWKEIGAALPWRPYKSVYYRAHILFERGQNSSWTPEEYELIRKFHEKHGADWKTLAEAMGKHRFHVKDTWRRIKLINMKKGKWSQDEYQSLFDLVNLDLRLKAFEERKTKHGMLRDNISWTAISEKLETRTDALCCQKWYDQLTSPMVAEGKWLDTDDYRLLMELYDLDACCMEDVEWDNLLEHRSGDLCRKRWNQMIKHLGDHRNSSFADQVDVLTKRYCPDVLEAREAYNSKPAVP
ncbi:unnamed protein product [Dovyalis caffra]|uniref:Myb-like domain-containing protein n=1 Tax=Dovyalis caffra TaxID=77055 RepID=A0AAV1SK02_9ROSI|nr:unnamed protein product [Dovyalis caffra]